VIIYPAIDLKDGACVRLVQGDMDRATVFADDPGAQAARFRDQGFAWLHVVDLNGAFAGRPVNAAAVEAIVKAVDLPVQLGGGIRDLATVEDWLSRGLARVILGTIAVRDPALVREACRLFPGKVAVGIDARDGMVAVEGWAETSTMSAVDLGLAFEDAGAAAIIYTDIGRDGTLQGHDAEQTARLAERLTTPVIASGGVASIDDIRAIKAVEHRGVAGVVTGRALYDGRLDPAAALAVAAGRA
jgi:phosphoribosylformimino-5-aminoimidazole carboxamide ribotide isomerase